MLALTSLFDKSVPGNSFSEITKQNGPAAQQYIQKTFGKI